MELNSADSHGNAEVQELVKEEDGALGSMDVKTPHFHLCLQDLNQTIEIRK
jgi:hypothetical protein